MTDTSVALGKMLCVSFPSGLSSERSKNKCSGIEKAVALPAVVEKLGVSWWCVARFAEGLADSVWGL